MPLIVAQRLALTTDLSAAGRPGGADQPAGMIRPGGRGPWRAAGPGGPRTSVAALEFTVLAATLMIPYGLWSFLIGLAAIIRRQFFVALPDYEFRFTITGHVPGYGAGPACVTG